MRRALILVAVTAGLGATVSWTTARRAPLDQDTNFAAGSAAVLGKVQVEDSSTEPISGAVVTLAELDGRIPTQTTSTDDAGKFLFAKVKAGRYSLSATKPGLLRSEYGARRPEHAGTPVVVGEGQQVSDLNIRMWKGAVISGVLRDAKGIVLSGATVQAIRCQTVGGEWTLVPVASRSTTDDRGVYRIYGLSPGEYLVVALPSGPLSAGRLNRNVHEMTDSEILAALQGGRNSPVGSVSRLNAPASGTANSTTGYAPVYYPGVPSVSDAGRLNVEAGNEFDGMDFALRLVPTAGVSGVLSPPPGVSLSDLRVNAVLANKSGPSGIRTARGVQVGADGSFNVYGVPPGDYVLAATAASPAAPVGRQVFWASSLVRIAGADVRGLWVALQPSGIMGGHLVFEGGPSPLPAVLQGIEVRLSPAHAVDETQTARAARVRSDGTFTVVGLVPGSYWITTSFSVADRLGWVLKSALVNGSDRTDSPVGLDGGLEDQQAILTFSTPPTELSGTLQDLSGRPATDYFLIVFPEDRGLWNSSRRLRAIRPATDGSFRVVGLPPGSYVLAASTDVAPAEWSEPEYLRQLAGAPNVHVSLRPGEKKLQDVRVGRLGG